MFDLNLPLYLLTWKIAPALAAGNTVVANLLKRSRLIQHIFLVKALLSPESSSGVINIVHGLGASVGEEIVKNKDVPVITFTGAQKQEEELLVSRQKILRNYH